MTLRKRMAEFGFESNEDYEFQLRALFASRAPHVRCLDVCGESGRRKTAFANALAHALEYPRMLYHDFSAPEPPPPPVAVDPNAEPGSAPEAPLRMYERMLVEACAYSEDTRTVLILDQLQAAEFAEQIRLYHFLQTGKWETAHGEVRANAKNLLVILVSEQPLYHSLAKVSYRIWTDARGGRFEQQPADHGLGNDARELFAALAALFERLGGAPTPSEFDRILHDLLHHVRTDEQLRHTLFGWMEGIDRAALFSNALAPAVGTVVGALNQYLGLEEVVLAASDLPPG
jgi:hypothetical protein